MGETREDRLRRAIESLKSDLESLQSVFADFIEEHASENRDADLFVALILSAIRDLSPIAASEYIPRHDGEAQIDIPALARKWLLDIPFNDDSKSDDYEGGPPTITFDQCAKLLGLSDLTRQKIRHYALETGNLTGAITRPGRQRRYRLFTQPFRKEPRRKFTPKKRCSCT